VCLHTIIEQPPKKTRGVGYKVFRNRVWDPELNDWVKRLEPMCHSHPNKLELGVWLDAITIDGHSDAGFHVYLNKRDSERAIDGKDYELHKVSYEGAIALGQGDGGFDESNSCRVVTAKRIFIHPEVITVRKAKKG
jgi:hypothetical protein